MRSWLQALAAQNSHLRMTPYEARFFADNLARFREWGPRLKWVTLKQYEFLRAMAARYLLFPKVAA